METTDRGGEAILIDVTGLSLDDLARLDDSVVANVIGHLLDHRCGEYPERFSAFNSSL